MNIFILLISVTYAFHLPLYNYDRTAMPFNLRPFVEDERSAEKSEAQKNITDIEKQETIVQSSRPRVEAGSDSDQTFKQSMNMIVIPNSCFSVLSI